ncbi:MAG: shikimate kinase [Pyrinomonadaceae bacterium]|nr:shikimate kinase [Pyrinomonadaceae bacterium]
MKTTTTQNDKEADAQTLTRIVLVGFMGAGKSSVARKLAEKMDVNHLDLDEYIEVRENRSITEIIENIGETLFRNLETDALKEVLKIAQSRVIALGGGTWTIEKNRSLIIENECQTIWLDAPFELCWQRIMRNVESRPLAKTEESARKLFDERQPIYKTANIRIEVSESSKIETIATEIFSLNDKPKKNSKRDAKIESQL